MSRGGGDPSLSALTACRGVRGAAQPPLQVPALLLLLLRLFSAA